MSMPLNLLFIQNIGPTEMLVILVAALVVFGGRLPQVARNLGRSFVEFKKGLRDLNSELRNELDTTDHASPPRPREKLAQPPVSQPAPAATEQATAPTATAPGSTSSTSTPAPPAPSPSPPPNS